MMNIRGTECRQLYLRFSCLFAFGTWPRVAASASCNVCLPFKLVCVWQCLLCVYASQFANSYSLHVYASQSYSSHVVEDFFLFFHWKNQRLRYVLIEMCGSRVIDGVIMIQNIMVRLTEIWHSIAEELWMII